MTGLGISKRFLTADFHFGHHNIIKYCDRPFENVHIMNRVLVENYNAVVSDNDVVYIAGDFCFRGKSLAEHFLKFLNGHKILIKGNHDKKSTTKAFSEVHKNFEIKVGNWNCIINHRPIHPIGTPDFWGDHDKSVDPTKYDFFLTGHVHNKWKWRGRSLNVGVDVWNFSPVGYDIILKELNNKAKELKEQYGEDWRI